jgi:hypothetical protein
VLVRLQRFYNNTIHPEKVSANTDAFCGYKFKVFNFTNF